MEYEPASDRNRRGARLEGGANMDELLTPAEMGEADRRTIADGTPGLKLMERAGRAVADVVARRPLGLKVMVLCGPGNNGGDGYVAARVLAERGYRVTAMALGDPARLTGDAGAVFRRWRGETLAADPARLADADILVDALFGAGLARPLDGETAALVEAANAAGKPIVAVDLPSGIDGETGAVLGVAIRAERSVTFARRKPGHLLLPGRTHCGAVEVADIGIDDATVAGLGVQAFANSPRLWGAAFPLPRVDGHKYGRGHAVVVAGGIEGTGAARLAAHAALRAGAGLVTLAVPAAALIAHAGRSPDALMVRSMARDGLAELLADGRKSTFLIGPAAGVEERTRERVTAMAVAGKRLVLDADALTSFAEAPAVLFALLRQMAEAAVLTPHDGEFARLFGADAEVLAATGSKLRRARAAARVAGAVVVLKGADTVIAAPDGRAAINSNAPAWLATAGSGDVLAGIIAGLRAAGMAPFDAACAGVWMHGAAGAAAGPGLIADDLPPALRQVMAKVIAELDGAG